MIVAENHMHLNDFDYVLPPECIAQVPLEQRDAARLLVDCGALAPEHRYVFELPELLSPGDLVVVNDTAVIPARLNLRRSGGGMCEVLLLERLLDHPHRWRALARPGRKLRPGDELSTVDGDTALRVVGRDEEIFTVEFVGIASRDMFAFLERYGDMPLPPYITTALVDRSRYQTVYAGDPGSAAAPTAGLHLTDEVFDRFRERGIETERVQLFVGLDTFAPITEADPRNHRIHTEQYRVPSRTMAACQRAASRGGRVVAIGTTAARALESAATRGELEGRTSLFIYRGYRWKVVDRLLTNFHMPRTTLLMMIDSFVGPRWRDLYEVALAAHYRFLSFGDAMLLDRYTDKHSGQGFDSSAADGLS